MNNTNNRSLVRDILVGLFVTIAGGLILAFIIKDARFAQSEEGAVLTPSSIPDSPSNTVSLEIFADMGWQESSIFVKNGQNLRIEQVSGEWTYASNNSQSLIDANGDAYVCPLSSCCEPLPDGRKGALIGKIGEEIFFIGKESSVDTNSDGYLSFRMNDCDADLHDNSGSILIEIETR